MYPLVSRYSYHLMCIPCLPISQLNVFNPHQRKSALKCCEHLPIDQRLHGVYCTPGVLSTVHCTPGAACQLRRVRDPVQTCPHPCPAWPQCCLGPQAGKMWRNIGASVLLLAVTSQWKHRRRCSGAVVQVRHQHNGSGVQCHRAVLPTTAKEVSNKDFFHPISSVLGAPWFISSSV